MASFFLASESGDVAFLGLRLAREGHTVRLGIENRKCRRFYDGLLPKATGPRSGDIVLFDACGKARQGATLRANGYAVIGGNALEHTLEEDRAAGQALMREVGIETPETHTFRTTIEAAHFLRGVDGAWFIKFSGDDIPTFATENCKTSEAMLDWLHYVEQIPDFYFRSLSLQRAVDGLEIDCDGWFDGQRFVAPFCSTVEDKKAWTGDLGARAGCAANVVWPWRDARLPEESVARLEETLRASSYVGNIALNMILTDDGTLYGLEWTARTGFDALQAFHLLVDDDLGEQLEAFAHGNLPEWSIRPELALTLRLSVPPWPMDVKVEMVNAPLDAKLDGNHPRILPDDVYVERGKVRLAGRDGAVGVVAAVGPEIDALRSQVLELADSLEVPKKQFRKDVVARYERVRAALQDHQLQEAA